MLFRSQKANGKFTKKVLPLKNSDVNKEEDMGLLLFDADGDGDNSIYTESLAKNMLLENTTIDQVFRNVRSEVLRITNGTQKPVEATQLTGQTFYLVKSNNEKKFKIADEKIKNKE